MANQFYKGAARNQIQTQSQALRGPDMSQAHSNVDARLQQASQAIDALNSFAQGSIKAVDTTIKTMATEDGEKEAMKDNGSGKVQSEASKYAWGGSTQRAAYNKVRSQSLLVDMPSVMEQSVADLSLKTFNKSVDELTYDQQAGLYQTAQDAYLKAKGIDKNPELFSMASKMAFEVQNKHLPKLHERSVSLGKLKAKEYIGGASVLLANSYKRPADLITAMDANDLDYAGSLGLESDEVKEAITGSVERKGTLGTKEAVDQAKLEGFLKVIVENPQDNLHILNFMKSPEFEERFGYMPEFSKVVGQMDKITSNAQENARLANMKDEENDVYRQVMSHSWSTPEQAEQGIMQKAFLDDKKKFEMVNMAKRFMKSSQAATSLHEAYKVGDIGQINAAPKETRDALFADMVAPLADISNRKNKITATQGLSLKQWTEKGGSIPEVLRETANVISMDANILQDQLGRFRELGGYLGVKNIGKIYNSRTQARLMVFENMLKTYGDDTPKKMDILKQFDEDSSSSSDFTILSQVNKELKLANKESLITDFTPEGGSNVFSGSSDMQPFFTARSVTAANQEYAAKDIKQRAYMYKLAGRTIEDATVQAIEDFKGQNQWVNIGSTSSYIPSEFDADEESLNSYIRSAKGSVTEFSKADGSMSQGASYSVIDTIMESKGMDPKDVRIREAFIRNNISLAPAQDYTRTKKLEILDSDSPTGEYIDIGGYKKHREDLISKKELDAVNKVNKERGVIPMLNTSELTPEMIKAHNQNAQALGISFKVKELFRID